MNRRRWPLDPEELLALDMLERVFALPSILRWYGFDAWSIEHYSARTHLALLVGLRSVDALDRVVRGRAQWKTVHDVRARLRRMYSRVQTDCATRLVHTPPWVQATRGQRVELLEVDPGLWVALEVLPTRESAA